MTCNKKIEKKIRHPTLAQMEKREKKRRKTVTRTNSNERRLTNWHADWCLDDYKCCCKNAQAKRHEICIIWSKGHYNDIETRTTIRDAQKPRLTKLLLPYNKKQKHNKLNHSTNLNAIKHWESKFLKLDNFETITSKKTIKNICYWKHAKNTFNCSQSYEV